MVSDHQIRPLANALIGLMLLVCLSLILLITSAFLYPSDEPPVNNDWEGHYTTSTALAKPVPLTEQQLRGKELFVNNCAQCHAVTEEIVVGPGLKGVTSRAPSEAWLLAWIRNSQAVVASGDVYGVTLYNKFSKVAMSSFPNLTDADVKAILAYVDASTHPIK